MNRLLKHRHRKYRSLDINEIDELAGSYFQVELESQTTERDSLTGPIKDVNIKNNGKKKISKINLEGKIEELVLDKQKKIERNDYEDLSLLNIGFYLITPIIIGTIIGQLIDQWLKKGHLFVLIFIFIGMISSLYNLKKVVQK